MNNLQCEICGSNNITVVDSVPTCQSCGTKYPKLKKEEISLDEKLKEEEILRLTTPPKSSFFGSSKLPEPQLGILTDDEILKYAPNSDAAWGIRFKRKGGWSAYLKHYTIMYMIFIFLGIIGFAMNIPGLYGFSQPLLILTFVVALFMIPVSIYTFK
ncbi:MAG: hypothetical protein LBT66_05330 [Methanobrevibacter sp.]|jgi:hypothetical protein|nr:hypothetical protein [Candidatus Methanovirga meridionalis]